MKLKELCESVGVEYDKKHPDRTLKNLRSLYLIKQNGNKKDYTIIRELTEDENIILKDNKL